MAEIDAVDALYYVLLSDDSWDSVQVVWSAEHVISAIAIPMSIVPTVPDFFFQVYTGSTIHLVWSSDCSVNRQDSISWSEASNNGQPSVRTEVVWMALLMQALVNNSVVDYEVNYIRCSRYVHQARCYEANLECAVRVCSRRQSCFVQQFFRECTLLSWCQCDSPFHSCRLWWGGGDWTQMVGSLLATCSCWWLRVWSHSECSCWGCRCGGYCSSTWCGTWCEHVTEELSRGNSERINLSSEEKKVRAKHTRTYQR